MTTCPPQRKLPGRLREGAQRLFTKDSPSGLAIEVRPGRLSARQGSDYSPDPADIPRSISLVVTTIGRPADLQSLLNSLREQSPLLDLEIVLVDQSADRRSTQVVRSQAVGIRTVLATSGRGCGLGRRVGIAAATGDLVAIPNDNCLYSPGLLDRVLSHFTNDPSLAGVSGRQLTRDGRNCASRWAKAPGPVTRTNFHRTSTASTLFLRRDRVLAAGSIDSRLGTGSPGPFQAGEESDLLLRMISRGDRIHYDPELVVIKDDPRYDVQTDWVPKMHGYGVGQGYLWRVHRLSRAIMGYRVVRKGASGLIHLASGQPILARADLAFSRGWVEGYFGVHRINRVPAGPSL